MDFLLSPTRSRTDRAPVCGFTTMTSPLVEMSATGAVLHHRPEKQGEKDAKGDEADRSRGHEPEYRGEDGDEEEGNSPGKHIRGAASAMPNA